MFINKWKYLNISQDIKLSFKVLSSYTEILLWVIKLRLDCIMYILYTGTIPLANLLAHTQHRSGQNDWNIRPGVWRDGTVCAGDAALHRPPLSNPSQLPLPCPVATILCTNSLFIYTYIHVLCQLFVSCNGNGLRSLLCIPARPACVAGCDTGGRTARQSPPGKLYTCAAILHTSLYWWLTVNRAAGATAGQSYTTTSTSK